MKRPLGYADGLGTGIAAVALVASLILMQATGELERMYMQMGPGAKLPTATTFVMSSAWKIGVPLTLIGGIVAAHVWRPRYVLVALAIVGIAVDVLWYFAAWAPIFQLSGNIR
jgi:hypothetical protein